MGDETTGIGHPIEKLESWQLGYIAGIIDGEGCIRLKKGKNIVAPEIQVTMTNINCIALLHKMTGVGKAFYEKRNQPKHWKQVYRWVTWRRVEIYLLLKAIQPYLVVKREHAILMLEFLERRILRKPFSERDFEMLTEMHKLNS